MDDPWARWNEIASLDPSEVPAAHRSLCAIGWLRTEINNDGFDGLFFNLAGAVVPEAAAAARKAGVGELADLIERAMTVLGETYPIDVHQRRDLMIVLSGAERDRLGALDEASYDFEASTDLDQLMRVLISGT